MVLGVTGGIGAGKTLVCEVFQRLGIPVYNADNRAKWLMNNEESLKAAIVNLFDAEAYQNETLNRSYISSEVFNDKDKLEALNEIVHPAVGRDFQKWKEGQTSPYVIREAAIMIESGSYKDLDKLVVVTAPEEVRIARVMKRDGVEEAEVRARMANQLTDEERMRYADFIIDNSGSSMLLPQVLQIHYFISDETT